LNFLQIPKDAEASNILVGELAELDKPLSAFIRLSESVMLGDLTEVPVPTRDECYKTFFVRNLQLFIIS
jgi:Band 3 cytoplasmic domain